MTRSSRIGLGLAATVLALGAAVWAAPPRARAVAIELFEQASAPCSSGIFCVYANTDHTIHVKTVAGADSSIGAGAGTVTSIVIGAGLASTQSPLSTTGTLSVGTAAVTNAMLQNSTIVVNTGSGLTGGATPALGATINLGVDSAVTALLGTIQTFTANHTFTGVVALNGGVRELPTPKSGPYTALINDTVISCDTTGGSFGITLPSPGTVGSGWEIRIYDAKNNSNILTAIRSASEKINFVAGTYTIPQGTSRTFYTDGTDWFVR